MPTEKEIQQKLKGKKILIATMPVDGHFNPLTGLAKYLQELGCEVGWYTARKYADRLRALGIRHYPFEGAMEHEHFQELFGAKRAVITDLAERINFDLTNGVINRTPEYYADIEALRREFPFELVAVDSLMPVTPLLRYKTGVPVACVGVFPLPIAGEGIAPYGMALPPASDEEGRIKYAQMQKGSEEVMFRPSIEAYERVMSSYGIDLPDKEKGLMDILVAHASVYMQIGVPSFEYERKGLSDHIKYIGALYPWTAGGVKKAWFDKRLKDYGKMVLVTQGTLEGNITKILVPTLKAFAGSDVLVVATTGGSRTAELREMFPYDNLIIEDYIPFAGVMPYADVYVTNGGYGGVLLSISQQLPIVAAGVFEHKNEICARIEYFGLGVDLKTETPAPEMVWEAAKKVMEDGAYKKNVGRLANEIGQYNARRLAAEYIGALL